MATAVQHSSLSSQLGALNIGLLNSKALPEGLNTVYLQGKLYKISDKKGSDPRIACAISLLNNLENETTPLANLKQEKRIGVLHVEGGQIKSLTLPQEQIQMMQENGVNEIAFKVNNNVLIIKDKMILREFTSEDEYTSYANHLMDES